MQIHPINSRVTETEADAVVVGVFEDAPLGSAAAEVDSALNGAIRGLVERKEFSGRSYEVAPLLVPMGRARQVLVVGQGRREKFDAGAAFRVSAAAARHLAAKPRASVAFFLDDAWPSESTEAGVCGAIVGCQGQDLYRAEKNRHPFGTLSWYGGSEPAIASGRILGESVNLTRRLVNEPADEIYPETFAARAAEVAKQNGLKAEIWDQKRLEAERCGALVAVAKGSSRPPRLVILRYSGAAKSAPALAIVGKGVTFDSGGINLKPSKGGMLEAMKMDMAGSAAVIATMSALKRLGVKHKVTAYVAATENLLGGSAYKPGDVVKTYNGKTAEVGNTDAEGRLTLADALSYAVDKEKPDEIIDLATLTGAAVVALGNDIAALFANNDKLAERFEQASQVSGEKVWRLPLEPAYNDLIKSSIADLHNTGSGSGAGSITAALFLQNFVGKTPWIHLDIAGPAWAEKEKGYLKTGGTGYGVRTLLHYLQNA